jgi:2-haloacid dehalogenase
VIERSGKNDLSNVKALVFDTWGTVVDWRTSMLQELRDLGQRKTLAIDEEKFLADWSAAYKPGMRKVNQGEWPWTPVSQIYRRALNDLLATYGMNGKLNEAEINHLNRAWTRTSPWADSVRGLTRLKQRYVLSTLSNGDFSWLVDIAKFGGLPFDCIITAENARRYKPDPAPYLTAVQLLGRSTGEVMLVAAHNYDLRAARGLGIHTAFICRPTEFGPRQTTDLQAEENWDVVARDMEELADQMGA